jgi:hypothetical protein
VEVARVGEELSRGEDGVEVDDRPAVVGGDAHGAGDAPDLHALVERALEVDLLLGVEEAEDRVIERADRGDPAGADLGLGREGR